VATAAPTTSTTGRPAYLLKRAQATLHAALAQALREHGATIAQYAVLTALDEEPGLSNADLARRAFVTPQTMNQVLHELEELHWVTRHPHPGHGRILQAALTDTGRQRLQACHHAADTVEKRMLAGLSPTRREQLATALHACIEALSQ
jgi:DNA-binding MarR family transcriptional regulator